MNDTNDTSEDAETSSDTPTTRRRRFDPRVGMLTSLGALIIVLIFAVVLSFLDANKHNDTAAPRASVGVGTIRLGANDATFTATTLPDAGLVTMNGNVTDLAAVADGRPTMINMFSNSCTACRSEMPALQALHEQLGDKVNMVGVNLGDSQAVTKKFVAETGVTYTIVRDPKLLLVERLDITAQPMTLWVNARGTITDHRYGALTPTEMRLAVRDHLGVEVTSS